MGRFIRLSYRKNGSVKYVWQRKGKVVVRTHFSDFDNWGTQEIIGEKIVKHFKLFVQEEGR